MEIRDLRFMTLQRVLDDLSKGPGSFAMDDGEGVPALQKGLVEITAHTGFGFITAESSHIKDKAGRLSACSVERAPFLGLCFGDIPGFDFLRGSPDADPPQIQFDLLLFFVFFLDRSILFPGKVLYRAALVQGRPVLGGVRQGLLRLDVGREVPFQALKLLQGLFAAGFALPPFLEDRPGHSLDIVDQNLQLPVAGFFPLLLVFEQFFTLLLQRVQFVFPFHGQGVEPVEQLPGVFAVQQQVFFGLFEDFPGQSLFPGHIQGLALSHLIVGNGVQGFPGLGLKKDRSGPNPLGSQSISLQGREMRGGHEPGLFLPKLVQDGLGQGRSLTGIGAGPEFVEQDQGPGIHAGPIQDQLIDLGGKCAQAFIKALLVAEERMDLLKARQPAVGLDRNRNGGQGHQGNEPQGFQGNGFASGVPAAQDESLLA